MIKYNIHRRLYKITKITGEFIGPNLAGIGSGLIIYHNIMNNGRLRLGEAIMAVSGLLITGGSLYHQYKCKKKDEKDREKDKGRLERLSESLEHYRNN